MAALIGGLLGLGLSASAMAGTVTYGPYVLDNGGPGFNAGDFGGFTVQQWDPALFPGQYLTKVTVQVTGNSHGGSNTRDSESIHAGTASVTIGSNITVSGPASLIVLTQPLQTNSGAITADTDTLPDYVGTDSIMVTGTNSTDTQSASLLSGFLAYIGSGNVPFTFTSTTNNASSSTVSPGVTYDLPPTFDFVASVTYEYAASVPTPAALPAGLGLMAVAGLLKRFRRS